MQGTELTAPASDVFNGVGTCLLERCPRFRGASMELEPEDVSLLERCPQFRGCYVQASMKLGHEDVSLCRRNISSLAAAVLQGTSRRYGVDSMPTFLFFKNREKINEVCSVCVCVCVCVCVHA